MTDPRPGPPNPGYPPPNTIKGSAGLQYGAHGVQVNVPAPAGLGRGVVTMLVLASAVMLAGGLFSLVKLFGPSGDPLPSSPQPVAPNPGPTGAAPVPDGSSGPVGASPPAAAPSAAAQGVRWQGRVRMSLLGLRLDAAPPSAGGGDSADLQLNPLDGLITGTSGPAGLGNLVLWTGRGTPTARQCADSISQDGASYLQVAEGSVLCVGTRAGRTALVTITSLGTDFVNGGTADVIVWSEISGRS
ncbi:hypothetical protein GCM10018781_05660 [Kitasatospora indigofera]|uniref:Uncharacterized protein n=1 Tax=Kitasatospora indigofera TaxID=67307 RepID=A0A919KKT1_9ACTN|nr:hypothetical protein [Kitasatospora indigofera]GHH60621.1 hypothetical protein GCM10018781_05660 [Kitasatospora indigofera]